jgi:hypothetical protein
MHGRILVKDGSNQVVEALNQSCTNKSLRDDLTPLTTIFLFAIGEPCSELEAAGIKKLLHP